MPKRRLALAREVLAPLQPAELASVNGAAPISRMHPVCLLGTTGGTTDTSAQHSACHSCEFACSYNCPTENCG